ncbi:MAG: alanine racemase [Kordiimonadaceae bacterium]|jgi:alanine racemase|nr:alanine racemase [Kordiimonadaceae bacterium]MBT6033064.1 alanine racemase [Kordiimonadaceae bacterium]
MNFQAIKLRNFFLLFTVLLIVTGGYNDQSFSQDNVVVESYPETLLKHITKWNNKQTDASQRPDTYIEINQKAFHDNIRLVKTKLLNDKTKLMVVIKSDAYGHGLELLGNVAEMAGADYFGITENHSLQIMKKMNLNRPIVRLRLASDNELMIAHANPDVYGEVEEMVGNIQMANLLSKLGAEQNRSIKIHLNLNTGGMSRNGFDMSVPKIRNQLLSLTKLKNIQVVGIMTHFPNADATDLDETRSALEDFKQQSNWIIGNSNLNRSNILLHVANTSTTLRLAEAHLDMVRVGSLVFGEKLEKEAPQALQQLMSVYSKVGQIVFYPKGSFVGYGSNHTLERDSYLANIPIGKVNGIPRDLVEVLIGGKRYPTVGNMSMNTTMVDITDSQGEIASGDEVVIFGKQNKDEIRVEDHWLSTISDVHSFIGQLNQSVRYSKVL